MVVRTPAPINQLLMMNPLQYKLYFWMFIRGISYGFKGTQDYMVIAQNFKDIVIF